MPWNPEHYKMKPKIIHTKTFYCDGSKDDYDQHPRVHYTFNNKVDSTDKTDKGYVVCEYCYAEFVYEPKKKLLPLKDHWIPGLTERPKQKDERTPSEKMQDELEPIPISCPMDEYYDEPESSADRDDYVNRILKGSG
jgi:uncharacterized Zn-finger protein